MNAEIAHPRGVFDLLGGADAEAEFLKAWRLGRLHHAWLVTGPEGVGKATFAYRAARRLLGARAEGPPDRLGSDPDDPVCRQIAARAHPDLVVVQREGADGKDRRVIPVDDARALPEFFAKSPAVSAWRVAIIDAADDLNANAANAVLKTLEEPPERGILILISHAPGSLLATLRSRCRTLRLRSPGEAAALGWLEEKAGVGEGEARKLLGMAGGAPGRAWRLGAAGAVELDVAARDLMEALPRPDPVAMTVLAEGFKGPAGALRFEVFTERWAARLGDLVNARLGAPPGSTERRSLDALAEVWESLVGLSGACQALNLDRSDAFFTALGRLRAAA